MAASPFEWTQTCQDASIALPLKKHDDFVGVILRGRTYASREAEPLTYKDLDDKNKQESQLYYEPDDGITSFRVVLDQFP